MASLQHGASDGHSLREVADAYLQKENSDPRYAPLLSSVLSTFPSATDTNENERQSSQSKSDRAKINGDGFVNNDATRTWVKRLNNALRSSDICLRSLALVALQATVVKCSADVLSENCESWVIMLCSMITRTMKQIHTHGKAAQMQFYILQTALERAALDAERRRALGKSHLPVVLDVVMRALALRNDVPLADVDVSKAVEDHHSIQSFSIVPIIMAALQTAKICVRYVHILSFSSQACQVQYPQHRRTTN